VVLCRLFDAGSFAVNKITQILKSKTMVRAAFLLLIPMFFIVSCQKGDTGPIGATGATGATGGTGTQGPAGSANVIYSDWFTPDAYVKDTVFGTWGFYYDSAVAAITQGILDSGTVITFGDLAGYTTVIWPVGQVEALPIVITYMDGANANIDTSGNGHVQWKKA
jgi:hypothetical protein